MMLLTITVLCLLLVVQGGTPNKQPMPTFGQPNPDMRLIFEDEFNELNFDVWQHERTAGGGGVRDRG